MLLKRLKAATFVFSLCTGFLSGFGWSADWYVSADGSNGNSGDSVRSICNYDKGDEYDGAR